MRLAGRRRTGEAIAGPSLLALALVTGVSPFATDTYLAALPDVQRSLHTTAGTAQLSMTAFIIGLAVGQLVFGPISDGLGRRRIMVASSACFAVLSAVCALAPSAQVFLIARAVQGLAGGCGVAVGRAVVSDRYAGSEAAVRYGTLATITLLAPIVAPAVGGLILLVGDWRAVFVFLTALGIAMTCATLIGIPETLPPGRRSAHGLSAAGQRMAWLLRRQTFREAVVIQCLATAGFFTYIGGSSFVLQQHLGLGKTGYTVLFASNAAGMAAASACFRATVRRFGPDRLRTIGVATSTASAVALATYATVAGHDVRLAPTWILLAVTVSGMGLTIPATTTIAQHVGRAMGGTAAALQGGLVFAVGAAATPLTGLTGRTTVAGMTTIMAVLFVVAAVTLAVAHVPRRKLATRPDLPSAGRGSRIRSGAHPPTRRRKR